MSAPEFDPPFEIVQPERLAGPLMYNSPHSGAVFPASFLAQSQLDVAALRQSSDLFVDALIADSVDLGVPLMRAHFPRSFLDVNREPYELDPRMFEGELPAGTNTRSLRVSSGYGTVARLVAESQPIYPGRIPVSEALRRIEHYYISYHAALRQALASLRRIHGWAVLVDWHSMPSAAIAPGRQVDIVLGDRNGTSCSPALIRQAERLFQSLGLTVSRNQPYAGGYITEHYGTPSSGTEVVQVEINRGLYMDEAAQQPTAGFDVLREALALVSEGLIAYLAAAHSPGLAAE